MPSRHRSLKSVQFSSSSAAVNPPLALRLGKMSAMVVFRGRYPLRGGSSVLESFFAGPRSANATMGQLCGIIDILNDTNTPEHAVVQATHVCLVFGTHYPCSRRYCFCVNRTPVSPPALRETQARSAYVLLMFSFFL